MLELQQVSFQYEAQEIIHNLSCTIGDGEFVAIAGPNGAGKSTLSKLMNGLYRPSSGKVLVNGMDTAVTKCSVLAGQIGFLFQNPDRQLCQRTIREELLFSLRCAGKDNEAERAHCDALLHTFRLDGEQASFQLSRGERQRVALASVLAARPQILLLDEPTTGLDDRECTQILEQISALHAQGVTVIMICHDMELVLAYAKRLLLVADGKLLADGKPRDLFRNPALCKAASLLPPQMIALSMRLGGDFADVDTPQQMAAQIRSAMRKEASVCEAS